MAVRPERLLLGARKGSCGEIEASLETPIYNGDHVMVPLLMRDGSALRAKLPIAGAGDLGLLNAEALSVGWAGINARAYRRA